MEFGCGTGRLAERLLRDHLPDAATYVAVDSSSTMVSLAQGACLGAGARGASIMRRLVQTRISVRVHGTGVSRLFIGQW